MYDPEWKPAPKPQTAFDRRLEIASRGSASCSGYCQPRKHEVTTTITLSATPKGNGYQATVIFADGVSMSSAGIYPSITEVAVGAMKLLNMPDRLEALGTHLYGVVSDGSVTSNI